MRTLSGYLRRHHIGLLALFIALGGTSYAAVSLPRNSVGPRELENGSVRSAEVRDGSIKRRDLRAGLAESLQGQAGGVGPQGPAGPAGPAGPVGVATLAQLPAARVRQAADSQTVPGDNTATVVSFADPSSEQYDIGDLFDQGADSTVLTIPDTGTYVVTAAVRWQGNPDGTRNLNLHGPQPGGVRASSSVPANDALVPPFGGGPPVTDTTRQSISTAERFNAGDEIFMSVSQTSGTDLLLDASQNQIHLSAAFIGP